MIFQEPMTSLNPVKKIGWQVEEALRLHTELSKEERKKRAIEMLEKVELHNPQQVYEPVSYTHLDVYKRQGSDLHWYDRPDQIHQYV